MRKTNNTIYLSTAYMACRVRVSAGNENDMLPVFTQTEYEFVVRADADIGDAAGNVVAIDGDAGESTDP